MIYLTQYNSPVGRITLSSDGVSLTGLWIQGQKYEKDLSTSVVVQIDELPVFPEAIHWLEDYFAGSKPDVQRLRLAPAGSAFRQEVWKILTRIPYGEVVTYGQIAREVAGILGKEKMSAQATGGAVGHNPISIIIPCHRVIGAGGNLTGYAGGIDLKIRLLTHEGVDMAGMYVPKKGTALTPTE